MLSLLRTQTTTQTSLSRTKCRPCPSHGPLQFTTSRSPLAGFGWLYMPLIPENQVLRDRRRGGARGALSFLAFLCEIICTEIAA